MAEDRTIECPKHGTTLAAVVSYTQSGWALITTDVCGVCFQVALARLATDEMNKPPPTET